MAFLYQHILFIIDTKRRTYLQKMIYMGIPMPIYVIVYVTKIKLPLYFLNSYVLYELRIIFITA